MKTPSSYDIIGSKEKAVAIVEIPDELKKKEKEIAKKILSEHKNVKTVLKKLSERTGVYRTRRYKYLLGDKNTEVIHVEYGCKYKLDPKKVYFSGREGTERFRIAEQVKPNEIVMLMFAGVGPYGILISKKQPLAKIIAIEINPIAFEYMKENIRLNRIDRIIPLLGDVKKEAKLWYGKCDRVIMPLPRDAEKFLGEAFLCLKKKSGIIHFYHVNSENDLFSKSINSMKEHAKKFNRKIRVLRKRKVLPYGPRKFKICIDCLVK